MTYVHDLKQWGVEASAENAEMLARIVKSSDSSVLPRIESLFRQSTSDASYVLGTVAAILSHRNPLHSVIRSERVTVLDVPEMLLSRCQTGADIERLLTPVARVIINAVSRTKVFAQRGETYTQMTLMSSKLLISKVNGDVKVGEVPLKGIPSEKVFALPDQVLDGKEAQNVALVGLILEMMVGIPESCHQEVVVQLKNILSKCENVKRKEKLLSQMTVCFQTHDVVTSELDGEMVSVRFSSQRASYRRTSVMDRMQCMQLIQGLLTKCGLKDEFDLQDGTSSEVQFLWETLFGVHQTFRKEVVEFTLRLLVHCQTCIEVIYLLIIGEKIIYNPKAQENLCIILGMHARSVYSVLSVLHSNANCAATLANFEVVNPKHASGHYLQEELVALLAK